MALIRQSDASEIARHAIVLDLGDVQRQAAVLMEQAQRRAEATLAEARAERERIVAGAAEQGKAAGLARGLEEGRKAGTEQGKGAALAEWRTRLEQLEKRWGEALRVFEAERDRMLTEARVDVLRLALKVAEKVVKRCVEVNPEVVAEQLAAVLALAARPTEVLVSLHPEDRATVQAAFPALLKQFPNIRHVELADDAGLSRGSCVARTRAPGDGASGGGAIDASLEQQLARIAQLLLPADGQDAGQASGGAP